MDLTVVVASIESSRSIAHCLEHLTRSCAPLLTEIIVVDASRDDSAAQARSLGRPIEVISLPPDTVAPKLWAAGYQKATGRVVAFTTGHCLVGTEWASALVAAVDRGAAGAGGPLLLARDTGPVDWAVFYLRYSSFMPHALGSGRDVREVAGDNAAYSHTALDRHASTFAQGFWEVDFHHCVRAEGGWLVAVPSATVEFGRSFPFGTILRHRFVHGRALGASRVRSGNRAAWQILLAAPLVPFLFAWRSSRQAFQGREAWRFVIALPWFLILAGAWAAGEAWGALRDT
jgi:hypothetical protein